VVRTYPLKPDFNQVRRKLDNFSWQIEQN